MKVVNLKIKNFLSISDAEIKPKKITQIVGQNNAGKTTILKAIEFAVKGGNDPSIVKIGADAAEVIVELDDSTIIRRRLSSEGKSTIQVKRDGFQAPSPQGYIDALFEHSLFNPLELLDVKKRNDAILKSIDVKIDADTLAAQLGIEAKDLPPLDYQQHGLKVIDECHKYFYQRRAEANKDALEKKKRWETYKSDLPSNMPNPASTKDAVMVEIQKSQEKLSNAERSLSATKVEMNLYTEKQSRIKKYTSELDLIKKQIEDKQKEIAILESRMEQGQKFLNDEMKTLPNEPDIQSKLNDVQSASLELEKVKSSLKEFDTFEAVQKQFNMVEKMEHEYQTAQAFAESLTKRVTDLSGSIKDRLMSCADMPISGLQYVNGEFIVNGVSVDNLSQSKAIRLAIGISRKLSKKTKIICIDGAEALDENTWKEMQDEIKDDGYTYIMTKVGDAFIGNDQKVISMKDGVAHEVQQ